MTLQVVTANRLDDGLAVFYNEDGKWYNAIDKATLTDTKEKGDQLLAQASVAENQLVVVGPYLIDVEDNNGSAEPVRYREKIRTRGPSVRPDLGYQAEK